jgi:chromosome segregation ATPase
MWPFDRLDSIENKLDAILRVLQEILRKEITMSAELDALTVQVKANTDVEASAVALLQGLSAQIEAAKTDPAALQTLADSLKTSAQGLADAIVANTPSA